MKLDWETLRGNALEANNAKVDAFRRDFHRVMLAKGYVREARIRSALYDWTYWQGKPPAKGMPIKQRRLSISGWHGTGRPGTSRFWGEAKSFFGLYDSDYRGFKVVEVSSIEYDAAKLDSAMCAALAYANQL
jgi:hypothetical protein